MKGATADPWVNTSNPPNSAIETMIGNSHNFLRTRRNNQNSLMNDNMGIRFSILPLHTVAIGGLLLAWNPVAINI